MFSSMVVLLIVIVGCFLMLELAPGDAVDAYAVSFGGDASAIAEMRALGAGSIRLAQVDCLSGRPFVGHSWLVGQCHTPHSRCIS